MAPRIGRRGPHPDRLSPGLHRGCTPSPSRSPPPAGHPTRPAVAARIPRRHPPSSHGGGDLEGGPGRVHPLRLRRRWQSPAASRRGTPGRPAPARARARAAARPHQSRAFTAARAGRAGPARGRLASGRGGGPPTSALRCPVAAAPEPPAARRAGVGPRAPRRGRAVAARSTAPWTTTPVAVRSAPASPPPAGPPRPPRGRPGRHPRRAARHPPRRSRRAARVGADGHGVRRRGDRPQLGRRRDGRPGSPRRAPRRSTPTSTR